MTKADRLVIYGASDDLIETEGALREEFNPPYDKPARVTVSEKGAGQVCALRIEFDADGEWRIQVESGAEHVTVVEARHEDDGQYDEDGCPGYSDKAVISLPGNGPLRVKCKEASHA